MDKKSDMPDLTYGYGLLFNNLVEVRPLSTENTMVKP